MPHTLLTREQLEEALDGVMANNETLRAERDQALEAVRVLVEALECTERRVSPDLKTWALERMIRSALAHPAVQAAMEVKIG